MEDSRLYGLRGATCCVNTASDIEYRVATLYDELLASNTIGESAIVSCIFSVTPDLTAINPAAALRRRGRGGELALFSVAEPVVDDSLPCVIRVLIHCYAPQGKPLQHIYLNGAEVLRPDRKSAKTH